MDTGENMAQPRFHGIWQQIAQYTISHLTQEPGPLVKIAFELLKGNLTSLPDHIVLSARLEWLNERVLAHAISPNGKIAILMARDDFSCGLVTWSQEKGLREQNKNRLWNYTERLPLSILFPTGSEEPLVYFGEDHTDGDLHHIRWDNFHHQFPAQPNIFQVTAWVEDGWQMITHRSGEQYILHRSNMDPGKESRGHISGPEPKRCWDTCSSLNWMGCINGRYAEILDQNGVQTLKWHGGKIVMPNKTHEIDETTISSASEAGIWFVSRTQERGIEYLWWNDNTETKCTENRGESINREGILLIREESSEVFVRDHFCPLTLHTHVLFRNNTVDHAQMRHTWKQLMRATGACYKEISRVDRLGPQVNEAHDGKIMNSTLLLWIEKKKRLLVYSALNKEAQTKVLPMYGPYFPTLAVVGPIDRREILGFCLVDSTLHIIRHRLW
jgi:hypothetical protein